MSCGTSAHPSQDLPAIDDARPSFVPPSLTASIRYTSDRSSVGWGSFDLTARPEFHEFRVGLMVGLPTHYGRWGACRRLDLMIDGQRVVLPARYSGVPMKGGVYDAVTSELTISDVRAMAHAHLVSADLCGEAVSLPTEQLGGLNDFVRRFEEMATYDGPPPPARPRDLDEAIEPSFERIANEPSPV
jgi:hypothetical protein